MNRDLNILVASNKNYDEAKHQLRYYFTILNAENAWRDASEYCGNSLPQSQHGDEYRVKSLELIREARALSIYNAIETVKWIDSYHFDGLIDFAMLERNCIDDSLGTPDSYNYLQCPDLLEWDPADASSKCYTRGFDTAKIMDCIQ